MITLNLATFCFLIVMTVFIASALGAFTGLVFARKQYLNEFSIITDLMVKGNNEELNPSTIEEELKEDK